MNGRLRVRRYTLPDLGDRVMIEPQDDAGRTWLAVNYKHRNGVACNPHNAVALIERARAEGFGIEEDMPNVSCEECGDECVFADTRLAPDGIGRWCVDCCEEDDDAIRDL